jgi:hypothetical protein
LKIGREACQEADNHQNEIYAVLHLAKILEIVQLQKPVKRKGLKHFCASGLFYGILSEVLDYL